MTFTEAENAYLASQRLGRRPHRPRLRGRWPAGPGGGSGWPRPGTGWWPRIRPAATRSGSGRKPATRPRRPGNGAAAAPGGQPRTNRNNPPPPAISADERVARLPALTWRPGTRT
jgi:hypothetical protein